MNYPKCFAAVSLAALLGACGGGGDSAASSAAPAAVSTAPATSTATTVAPAANVVGPGEFMSAAHLKKVTTAEVTSALAAARDAAFLATPRYAVETYRVTYVTVDGQGRQVAASGLVAIPQKPLNAPSPVLSYQHATIKRQADAPSSLSNLGDPPVVLASLGYIVVAADYVGYGVSAGIAHPYLLSAPSASAVIDMLTAAKYWLQTQNVVDNKQLLMTGYSEGGYVTMAAHRALQAGTSVHRNQLVRVVTAAGPYDVATTLDQQFAKVREDNFLLAQLFNPGLLKYLGDSDRRNVRNLLMAQVLGSDAEVTFMPNIIDNYLADDRAAIEAASNVFDWAPQVPVSLFHGRDDRTVTYLNATIALQAMQARGAGSRVTLTNCVASPAGHAECVLPYWRFVLDEFAKVAKDL